MSAKFDFERVWESKRKMRQRLTTAPIAEKLRMLDALRERALAIRACSAKTSGAVREAAPSYKSGK